MTEIHPRCAAPGEGLYLIGANFGVDPDSVTVTVGGLPGTLFSLGDSALNVEVPRGVLFAGRLSEQGTFSSSHAYPGSDRVDVLSLSDFGDQAFIGNLEVTFGSEDPCGYRLALRGFLLPSG